MENYKDFTKLDDYSYMFLAAKNFKKYTDDLYFMLSNSLELMAYSIGGNWFSACISNELQVTFWLRVQLCLFLFSTLGFCLALTCAELCLLSDSKSSVVNLPIISKWLCFLWSLVHHWLLQSLPHGFNIIVI